MGKNVKILLDAIVYNDDENAFEQLYHLFYARLFSFSFSILKDRNLTEEHINDIFLKIWNNRKLLLNVNNFSYYLYISARNSAYNSLKKRKIKMEFGEALDFSFQTPESDLINRENIASISDAINQLPPKCKLIFRMIKEDGLKYKEVAEILGLSVKTVEGQMYIAITRIAETIEKFLPEYVHIYKNKIK